MAIVNNEICNVALDQNVTFYAGFSVNDFLAKQFHASYIDF